MRIITIFIILVVILPLSCFFLMPSLSGIDFMSLDVTIFSITLALITFFAPTLLKLKMKVLEVDKLLIKNKELKASLIDNQAELLKKVSNEGDKDVEETIAETHRSSEKLREQAVMHKYISDDINNTFSGYHDYMKLCLFAIVMEIVVNEFLFTSSVFSEFVKDDLSCVSCHLQLGEWKIIISSYIKLASLSLQLIFLSFVSNDMIYLMKNLKYE